MSCTAQKEYEELDRLHYEGVQSVERTCRKLRAGQVAFSPSLKVCMATIKAWSLLLKRAQGRKVSSRYLDRTLKKAGLGTQEKTMGEI